MKRFAIPLNKLKSNDVTETVSSVSDPVDPNDPLKIDFPNHCIPTAKIESLDSDPKQTS